MKSFIYNLGYFFKETARTIRHNLLSNLFSLIGTTLILFILGMVLSGGEVGNRLVKMLSKEAEISAYFNKDISDDKKQALVNSIKGVQGVWDARLVSGEQAREDMKEVLGEESKILELFDDNPFEAYIEIRIHIEAMDSVLDKVKAMDGIEYVRDNREVLTKLKGIMNASKLLGYLVILAVSITTVIILSHMIRQGIYNNREQIQTLRLLGAPNGFIGFPYVLTGLLLTLAGGLFAASLMVLLINWLYVRMSGAIPFLPMPPRSELITHLAVILPLVSVILGFLGSLFGLSSIKNNDY